LGKGPYQALFYGFILYCSHTFDVDALLFKKLYLTHAGKGENRSNLTIDVKAKGKIFIYNTDECINHKCAHKKSVESETIKIPSKYLTRIQFRFLHR